MSAGPTALPRPVLPPLDLPVDSRDDEPGRRLSWSRVSLLVSVVVALAAGVGVAATRSLETPLPVAHLSSWFAPYVDATVMPLFQFQNPYANPSRQAVLGFVVADPQHPCEPSWGGAYDLDGAADDLNLDRRIAQVQAQGGDLIVSFGGVAHDELAVSCTDVASLTAAYSRAITRYKVTTVDFDVEGPALDDAPSRRRAAALAGLQRQAASAGRPLDIWLTLPVARSGMDDRALSAIRATLAAGVHLAGVNVMAMDFGGAEPDMGDAVHDSLVEAHQQLATLYARAGQAMDSPAVWRHLAVTVMIGQNDVAGETFTTADARRLVRDVEQWRLARVSMWSINRDRPCTRSFSVVVHSNVCSGVDQGTLAFSQIFGGLTGAAASSDLPQVSFSPVPDDPATSPFPLWRPGRAYVAGYKVVRSGNVYQARWFTRGNDPTASAGKGSQKAWQLIGPVLPGDRPTPPKTLPEGTYPRWSAGEGYPLGSRVLFQGLPYQAKWHTQGASPADEEVDPTVSPWQPLFTLPGEPPGS